MKRKTKMLAAILALVITALALCACTGNTQGSSSSVSSSSTGGGTSTSQSDGYPAQIKVAYIGPFTGDRSLYAKEISYAIEMIVEEINAAGGVSSMGGAQIVYEFFDDKDDPKETVVVANKIVSDPSFVACLGPYATSNGLAAKPIFDDAKIPLISSSVSNVAFTEGGGYCFSTFATQDHMYETYAKFLYNDVGFRKGVVLNANSEWGQLVFQSFKKHFEALGGEIVFQEAYEVGTKDFKPQLAKLKNYEFEFVHLAGHIAECGPIVNQLAELEIQAHITSDTALMMQEFIDVAGANCEGQMLVGYFSPNTDNPPAFESYRTRYLERFTDMKSVDAHIFSMGDTVLMLHTVLEHIGESGQGKTVPELREAIAKTIPTLTFQGMVSEYIFTPEGQAIKPLVPCIVKDGKFVKWTKEIWETFAS